MEKHLSSLDTSSWKFSLWLSYSDLGFASLLILFVDHWFPLWNGHNKFSYGTGMSFFVWEFNSQGPWTFSSAYEISPTLSITWHVIWFHISSPGKFPFHSPKAKGGRQWWVLTSCLEGNPPLSRKLSTILSAWLWIGTSCTLWTQLGIFPAK